MRIALWAVVVLCLAQGSARAQDVFLSCQDRSTNEAGFHFRCGSSPQTLVQVGASPVNTCVLALHSQTVGQLLYCSVRAYNAAGESGDSPVTSFIVTLTVPTVIATIAVQSHIP